MDEAYEEPPESPPPAKKKRGPKPGARKRKREEAEAAEREAREKEAKAQRRAEFKAREGSAAVGSDEEGSVGELEPVGPATGFKGGPGGAGRAGKDGSDEEDEDEGMDADMLQDMMAEEDSAKREETKRAFAVLMRDHFSEEQKDRYETYRRSGFKPASVRRLVNHVLQQSVSANIVLAFRGLSKVFVGEIIELARRVQAAHGQTGPLLPEHIREAHRIWSQADNVPGGRGKKMFSR